MIKLVTVSFQQLAKRCLSRRMMTILILLLSPPVVRDVFPDEPIRCVVIDVYYRSGDANHPEFLEKLEKFKTARGGIILALRDVTTEERNRERLHTILKHFRIVPPNGPVLYGCNRVLHKATPEATWQSQLEEMLQLEVFVRSGCSRCAAAKQWLPTFMKEYPGLKIVQRDIAVDGTQAARLVKLVEKHQTAAASVPVFHLCDRLVVGFHQAESSGGQLRNLLKPWTRECPQEEELGAPPKEKVNRERTSSALPRSVSKRIAVTDMLVSNLLIVAPLLPNEQAVIDPSEDADDGTGAGDSEKPSDELALPMPGDDLMIGDGSDSARPGTGDSTRPEESTDDQMDIPVFGRLSARKLGLPVFTIAVGLVDGFNPCAMWVLLFLLSILVNLKDRRRIFAIAGTFVVVSGLAYFAFMAAWLNVFMLIGYLRPIQVVLALMAVLIGTIHVKDFFAFKKGISLSIPESAKPGIYARVRRIVNAEHLAGAVTGAVTLAVLVNVVELLCTAGLPALYTNILMQQGLSATTRYAYIGLYILAYMFDDGLMVLIVVWSLSKTKLQETQGRWLKLMSGLVILLLGIIMLIRPELLH
jgi:hypothetical protein